MWPLRQRFPVLRPVPPATAAPSPGPRAVPGSGGVVLGAWDGDRGRLEELRSACTELEAGYLEL